MDGKSENEKERTGTDAVVVCGVVESEEDGVELESRLAGGPEEGGGEGSVGGGDWEFEVGGCDRVGTRVDG